MKRSIYLFVVAAVAATGLYVYNSRSTPLEFSKIESANLKDIYLFQDKDAETITLHLNYPKGEMANPYAEGLAHYVEHLAANRFIAHEHDNGGRHKNAWTNLFATAYWSSVTKSKFAASLQALATTAAPLQVDEKFALEERGIVLREYDLRGAGEEMSTVFYELDKAVYEDGPAARSVLGHPSDIKTYSLTDAIELHLGSHVLSEASLLIHGNLSKPDVLNALESIKWPEAPLISLPIVPHMVDRFEVARQHAEVTVNASKSADLLYRKLALVEDCKQVVSCFARIHVLEKLLDSAMEGGVAGPLRYQAFFARSFDFDLFAPGPDVIAIYFSANADRDVSHQDLLAEFERVLAAKLTSPMPKESFERAKARAMDGLDQDDLDSQEAFEAAIDYLAEGLVPIGQGEIRAAYEAVTLQDIQSLAVQMAGPGRVVIRSLY